MRDPLEGDGGWSRERLQTLKRRQTACQRETTRILVGRTSRRVGSFSRSSGTRCNPKFSDAKGACLVISDDIFAMLLSEQFFQSFIKKRIADAKESTETVIALSVENRAKVDALVKKAVTAGGKTHREPQDYGWMYGQAIEDLDGHIWEIFCGWTKAKNQRNERGITHCPAGRGTAARHRLAPENAARRARTCALTPPVLGVRSFSAKGRARRPVPETASVPGRIPSQTDSLAS